MKLPYTISTRNVLNGVKDPLLPPKISFFVIVASTMEPFLKKFQIDLPLAPFLYSEVVLLLNVLLEKFIIESKITKNLTDISKIDFKDIYNFLPIKELDVGLSTKKLLRVAKCLEKEKLIFLKDCQKFLISVVNKLLERSCLNYKLVEGISCLDPDLIKDKPDISIKK